MHGWLFEPANSRRSNQRQNRTCRRGGPPKTSAFFREITTMKATLLCSVAPMALPSRRRRSRAAKGYSN
jgi:hypothetical protein